MINCCIEGCTAFIQNHKWGKIHSSDWFFMKDGKSYCPDHIPDWYESWKARKEQEALVSKTGLSQYK